MQTWRVIVTAVRRLLSGAGLRAIKLGPADSLSSCVRILSIPGVFRPWDDSALLVEVLSAGKLKPGATVLDMCTGSGVLSIVTACLGAGSVTAVDISRRALLCTRLNALFHHARVRTRRGDLFEALDEAEQFDVIVSNPPWMPSTAEKLSARGIDRAWEAGRDGRALIDRVCAEAPARLRPGGYLLLVQASFCDVFATVESLTSHGLDVQIVARRVAPMLSQFGERAWEVQRDGPWARADSSYEMVVIRASRPLLDDEPSDGVKRPQGRSC